MQHDSNPTPELTQNFWTMRDDLAHQRMTTQQWKSVLLEEKDRPLIRGRLRQLVATNMGAGVVEVRLAPLED